jgi:hypothetical protein
MARIASIFRVAALVGVDYDSLNQSDPQRRFFAATVSRADMRTLATMRARRFAAGDSWLER